MYLKAKSIPRFTTATVNTGKVETVVNSTGTVKPVRSVSVGAFVSGPIAEILVDFNDEVKKGDLLARIDPRLYKAALDRRQRGAGHRAGRGGRGSRPCCSRPVNNEKRAIDLRKVNTDFISDAEMDQFQFAACPWRRSSSWPRRHPRRPRPTSRTPRPTWTTPRSARRSTASSSTARSTRARRWRRRSRRPSCSSSPRTWTRRCTSSPRVDEADIGLIRAAQEQSQPVTFTVDAYPDDLFDGKIFQIRKNSTTTQNVVTYPVVVAAPNPDLKLLPGMTASISFQIDERENVLRIPTAALRFFPPRPGPPGGPDSTSRRSPSRGPNDEGEEKLVGRAEGRAGARPAASGVVWVVDGDRLRAVPVVIGLSDSKFAELVAGDLKPRARSS